MLALEGKEDVFPPVSLLRAALDVFESRMGSTSEPWF